MQRIIKPLALLYLLIFIGAVGTISACGQKGPLILPEESTQQ